ncbi:hypothetical protein LXA43DRAFT_308954 [Ganoderma leucocontextum]|nr:hypothetical protein LXA43DRAFT_308954 [Ganoderma leucocontextum]
MSLPRSPGLIEPWAPAKRYPGPFAFVVLSSAVHCFDQLLTPFALRPIPRRIPRTSARTSPSLFCRRLLRRAQDHCHATTRAGPRPVIYLPSLHFPCHSPCRHLPLSNDARDPLRLLCWCEIERAVDASAGVPRRSGPPRRTSSTPCPAQAKSQSPRRRRAPFKYSSTTRQAWEAQWDPQDSLSRGVALHLRRQLTRCFPAGRAPPSVSRARLCSCSCWRR